MGENLSSRKKSLRAIEPKEPIHIRPVHVVPPPPHRSSRISHPTERYLSILIEDVEKIFLMEDRKHKDDLEKLL